MRDMNPATSIQSTTEATRATIPTPFCKDMDLDCRTVPVSDHMPLTKFGTCVRITLNRLSCVSCATPVWPVGRAKHQL